MEKELDAILALPFTWRQRHLAGRFVLYEAGTCLTVMKAGIGPVRGAMAAQVAILQCIQSRPIDVIVSLGVGGALNASLKPGDLVLATRVIKHDTRCGDKLMVPGCPWVSLTEEQRTTADPSFDCDVVTMAWIREILGDDVSFDTGALLSGDEFVNCMKRKSELANLVNDACMVDMEAGGIVQVAKCYGVAFVALRTTADTFQPNVDDVVGFYLNAMEIAAACAAKVVERIWMSVLQCEKNKE